MRRARALASAVRGAVVIHREQSPQTRSRQVPEFGSSGLVLNLILRMSKLCRKPAAEGCQERQAPDELRRLRRDKGGGGADHEDGDRNQRDGQQLRIVATAQRENP